MAHRRDRPLCADARRSSSPDRTAPTGVPREHDGRRRHAHQGGTPRAGLAAGVPRRLRLCRVAHHVARAGGSRLPLARSRFGGHRAKRGRIVGCAGGETGRPDRAHRSAGIEYQSRARDRGAATDPGSRACDDAGWRPDDVGRVDGRRPGSDRIARRRRRPLDQFVNARVTTSRTSPRSRRRPPGPGAARSVRPSGSPTGWRDPRRRRGYGCWCTGRRLPKPVAQFVVRDRAGFVARVDLAGRRRRSPSSTRACGTARRRSRWSRIAVASTG